MVDTKEKKVRRFLKGLRPIIQNQLAFLTLTEYRAIVNRALVVERGLDDRQWMFEMRTGKRGGDNPQGGGGFIKKQKDY